MYWFCITLVCPAIREPEPANQLSVLTLWFHNPDCGLTHTTDDGLRKVLKEKVPGKEIEIDNMKFGEITKYERLKTHS